jgi:hypothetical protein
MDCFAVPLAWITIVVIQVSLVALGYFAYAYSNSISTDKDTNTTNSTILMWIAAICWILAGLYYVVIACNFKSLRVSIAIVETAAEWFTDTKRIVLIPLIYFCFWVAVFVFWIWGLAGVFSISDG